MRKHSLKRTKDDSAAQAADSSIIGRVEIPPDQNHLTMKNFVPPYKLAPIFCLLGILTGCGPKEEIEELQPIPKPGTEFVGSVDSKLVGQWATKDGKMKLSLKDDGKARMQATVGTQIGPQKVDSSLEWKVNGSTIAFKDEREAVSQYQIKLTGNELRLSSSKSLTIYFKEK